MILADGHVHIHDCFELSGFLDSALTNFQAEAVKKKRGGFSAILFLTETEGENRFLSLFESINNTGVQRKRIDSWTFHKTQEACSLRATRKGYPSLFMIAGRQVVTLENLEVLALATSEVIIEGTTLGKTVQQVRQQGAMPVIPWGAGKWFGKHGTVLKNFLETTETQGLFLCDNGGRPTFWPRPALFRKMEQRGVKILSGSDPLPIATESKRPGSSGFLLKNDVTPETPARDLKHLLLDPITNVDIFGKREKVVRFFRNQAAMQILKHHKRNRKN